LTDEPTITPAATIPQADYDQLRADVSRIWDYHSFIRKAAPTIRAHGDAELNMDLDHFDREYGLTNPFSGPEP
jgi:hypothetical protein